jgi:hypothetical protein
MSGGVRGDGGNGAGGRGVNGQHSSPAAGQRLAAQHPVAHFDAQFAFGANVLLQRMTKRCGRETWRSGVPLDWVFISGG